MSYEPRGKMIDLMAAFRAEPQRVFKLPEVAAILCCKAFPSTIDQYLFAAVASGGAYKRQVDGAWYYAGSVVDDLLLLKAGVSVQPRKGQDRLIPTGWTREEAQAALADPRAPRMDPAWTPPKMIAPRPGSEQPRVIAAPAAAPPPDAREEQALAKRIAAANERVNASMRARADEPRADAPTPTPPPEPAPVLDDASITKDPAAEEIEEEEEPVEFNAALWLDGDVVIYGAVETEDGGVLITKDQLAKLKRLIAWSAL